MRYKDTGYNRLLAGDMYNQLQYSWSKDNQDNLIAEKDSQETGI